ncbi:hypothetical protein K378_01463 [Streptomyces sp. Amel2xB2]|uniref:hypothetical protein n=1 Tax=Streptomyces sp. Amel2xB2 TaxID=1305829 RepID=UPI000DB9B5F4|nr:hypothetical protein [Streptomyces sp. Amel2xB2]RAJ70298.1 hypothetical protein K378_01463 [Streptomyces sp. Amel2xB2]
MTAQSVGQLLDSLGATLDLDEGDMVTDVMVMAKVIKADGDVSLVKGTSESLDWISAVGMLSASLEIEHGRYRRVEEDE